jgi:hypothetical protein
VAVPSRYIALAFWDVAFEHRKLPICSDSAMWNTDELDRNKNQLNREQNFHMAEASCVATINLATNKVSAAGK